MTVRRTNTYSYLEAEAAVIRLGIKNQKQYRIRYHEDSMLPSTPAIFYQHKGWINWFVFVGKRKPIPLYPTYQEAHAAVLKMGLKNRRDYMRRRGEDPRLPGDPSSAYAIKGWPGSWHVFLGVKRYTYEEAKAACSKLKIKSIKEYVSRYREDPLLPSVPRVVYRNEGWVDWYSFLDKRKGPTYTYEEAQAACRRLKITKSSEYALFYKKDPGLPRSPHQLYAGRGWIDWYHYLGKRRFPWYSYNEARRVCRELNIRSNNDYCARYREDKRLPSAPERVYLGIGWVDWYEFIGTRKAEDFSLDYPNILADAERWIKTQTSIPIKRTALRFFLNGYVKPLGLPDESLYVLHRSNSFDVPLYSSLIEELAPTAKQSYNGALVTFFEWLLHEYCTDEEGDERVVLPEFRNPLLIGMAEYFDGLERLRPSQSVKPVLGYEYILRARNYLVPNCEASLLVRPTLKSLAHLQGDFDSSSDWLDVDRNVVDENDENCVWREISKFYRNDDGSSGYVQQCQVWSPVRFVALYTLLRFPLRGQQILWLDSGEADQEIAVLGANGAILWEKNQSKLVSKRRRTRRPQGVLQHGEHGALKCYVTTNKTGRKVGGYEVDWIPDDLAYWLILLRDWQRKYNPISKPTAWTDIKLPAETNEKILEARESQCFLFRVNGSGQPLDIKKCFPLTLPMILYKVQRDSEDLATFEGGRRRYTSKYTPHSLRVSLITAYIADGDAPLHLISKLVGHASLVMTIYYTKLKGDQIRRPMGEVEKQAAQRSAERTLNSIRLNGLSAVKGQLIATDGNRALLEFGVPKTACVVFDCGICPMSAAGCHIGGEVVVERQKEEYYSPVEAGYLGQKNCIRCRFFITGVPFLGGLVALANEISLEINAESARYVRYTDELNKLEQEFYDACRDGGQFMRELERKQAVANQELSAGKLEVLLRDYAALNAHVQGCLKLIKHGEENGGGNVRLIASGEVREIGLAFQESESSYHLLAEICQNATIYKFSNPSRAIPLISQVIDRMAENNGLPASMFRLTDEQKLVVANELTNLLVQRLGSWDRIDELFTGKLMLLDVDAEEPCAECISSQVQKVLARPHKSKLQALDQRAVQGA